MERTPPGIIIHKPLQFDELEPLLYYHSQKRFRLRSDNTAMRPARPQDERNKPIPEITMITDFFASLTTASRGRGYTTRCEDLNVHVSNLRGISPLYVAMQSVSGRLGVGRLEMFVNTDTGIQPLLSSQSSRRLGLPALEARFADPVLMQRVGPANLRVRR